MAITLIFKGWVSIHAFLLRIYNWITINLLWNSLFKDWILLVFFSMKKYSQIFLLLIHAKKYFICNITDNVLFENKAVHWNLGRRRQWVKDSGTCWCIDTLQRLKDERTNTSTAFQVFFWIDTSMMFAGRYIYFQNDLKNQIKFQTFRIKMSKISLTTKYSFPKMASHLYIRDCKVN